MCASLCLFDNERDGSPIRPGSSNFSCRLCTTTTFCCTSSTIVSSATTVLSPPSPPYTGPVDCVPSTSSSFNHHVLLHSPPPLSSLPPAPPPPQQLPPRRHNMVSSSSAATSFPSTSLFDTFLAQKSSKKMVINEQTSVRALVTRSQSLLGRESALKLQASTQRRSSLERKFSHENQSFPQCSQTLQERRNDKKTSLQILDEVSTLHITDNSSLNYFYN